MTKQEMKFWWKLFQFKLKRPTSVSRHLKFKIQNL